MVKICDKHSTVIADLGWKKVRVDSCMREMIERLNKEGIHTLACCCGHNGKHPMTIIYQVTKSPSFEWGRIYELRSGRFMPRKRLFYRKDKQGYFYIPELKKNG